MCKVKKMSIDKEQCMKVTKIAKKPTFNQNLPTHSLSHIVNSIQKTTKTNSILYLHTTY